jgi:prepilin-type N-terminal cleavage/methylation domain-containing protein
MKKSAKKLSGFTLIELLIVIALLGALAIGLLATVDPFEQLKKGRDTATRNTVEEFYNASLRYYSTKGDFPWFANGNTDPIAASTNLNGAQFMGANKYIEQLVAAGELKSSFTAAAGSSRLDRVFVVSTDKEDLGVCFTPESKNFRQDQNDIYNPDGSAITAAADSCIAQNATLTTATTCMWCIH